MAVEYLSRLRLPKANAHTILLALKLQAGTLTRRGSPLNISSVGQYRQRKDSTTTASCLKAEQVDAYRTGRAFSFRSGKWGPVTDLNGEVAYADGTYRYCT